MEKLSGFQHSTRYIVALGVVLGLVVSWLGASGTVQAQQTMRIIWLHHSCGQNLIEQGRVREGLTTLGCEFYDHGYNEEGLRLADGSYAGYNYDIPGDNTDPDGLAQLFGQPLHDQPDNAFSQLMQYDVIAFKSCFPTSNIGSDEQLAEYQSYYRAIRDRIAQHPDKLFITVTQPPQVPGASDPEEATRARALANWLQSSDYLAGLPNLVTFDFFGQLAGNDNFLRPEYRMDDYDAHPNERANQVIGPRFVQFVDHAIRSFEPGAAPVAPPASPAAEQPTAVPEAVSPPEVAAVPPAGGNVVEDYESGGVGWHADQDESGSSVTCTLDTDMAHSGGASLRAEYSMMPLGWGGCQFSFESLQDWSGGEGFSFWIRSDGTGHRVNLMIFAGDPMGATPFELFFDVPAQAADAWTQLAFPWSDLNRAEWADPGGLAQLDPGLIVGYGFGLGLDQGNPSGILWVDDIELASARPPAPPVTEPGIPTEPAQPPATEPGIPTEPAQPPPEAPTLAPEPVSAVAPEPAEGGVAMATAEVVVLAGPTAATRGKSGGGICPLAAMLPLGAAAILLVRRRA